ncbi:MAG: hypothetical protein DCC68_14195 [Planctomycetota bacterium]|nr:MAG: hypothetical protein DCC68_14195 [Planctomycetota bacterium]
MDDKASRSVGSRRRLPNVASIPPEVDAVGFLRRRLCRRSFPSPVVVAAVLFAAACYGPRGDAAEPIAPDKFAALHKLIQPTADESAWLSIRWQTDLWQAREKAATEGKPILLWEMDGHPLGCT